MNNKFENVDDAIINIFRNSNLDFDKLFIKNSVPVPEGSTFYDGIVEEVWGSPIENWDGKVE